MSIANVYLKNLSQVFLYYSEKGFLTNLHPLTKIVLMFTGIAVAILCTRLVVLVFALLLLLSMALTSISIKRIASLIISLMLFVLPMILFTYIYTLFRMQSAILLVNTSISIVTTMVRLLVMSMAFYVFFITTRPQSIARILNRVGVPYKYGYGFAIALRFLSVVADDLVEVLSIQKTRGLFLGKNFLDRVRSYLAVFIPLIISSLNRIDELTISLEVKGFGFSRRRIYMYSEPFRLRDAVFICLCLAGLATAIYFCI